MNSVFWKPLEECHKAHFSCQEKRRLRKELAACGHIHAQYTQTIRLMNMNYEEKPCPALSTTSAIFVLLFIMPHQYKHLIHKRSNYLEFFNAMFG